MDHADFSISIPPSLRRFLAQDVSQIAADIINEGIGLAQQRIMADTPVDTTDARNSWTITKEATPDDPEARLSNNKPYILALEYGSESGEHPWPYPGEKTEYVSDGLNAGKIASTQAPYGMIRINKPVIKDFIEGELNRRLQDV